MADAEFFRLMGYETVPEEKMETFRELVSLFDSLHDFGKFGSVYDYVTGEGPYITNKKTVFNHLRNGYGLLEGVPDISRHNSQFHYYGKAFNIHLKTYLGQANLEDTFFSYAKGFHTKMQSELMEHGELTKELLNQYFGNNLVFSVDTQKKLFKAIQGKKIPTYQVYDREKRCDPASHTKTDAYDGNVRILIENISSNRAYTEIKGVTRATIGGNAIDRTSLKIDIGSSEGPPVVMDEVGTKHKNNITSVNNTLKAIVLAGLKIPANLSIKPSINFYNENPYNGSTSEYIINIRRKLAQKRLGDQMQVLACRRTIQYNRLGLTYNVKYPIFVSIDRMAIAYALSYGIPCIYSNGSRLQLFQGDNNPIMERVEAAQEGGQIGGFREDWNSVKGHIKDLINNEPEYLLSYFTYKRRLTDRIRIRTEFSNFIEGLDYLSIDVSDDGKDLPSHYHIRSYEDSGEETLNMHKSADPKCLVFLKKGEESWHIRNNGEYITLKNDVTGNHYNIKLDEVAGFFNAGIYEQEGGGINKTFMKTLVQYELLTFFDAEQSKIWYDEFYISMNGKAFHSPTFYELNAFFSELFKTSIDYKLIFSFLKDSHHPFSSEVLYGLERMIEYMDLKVDYNLDVDGHSKQVLKEVIESASIKSKEYGKSLSSFKGSELLNYILENDLSPLYFYNEYNALYNKAVPKVASKTRKMPLLQKKMNKSIMIPVTSGGKKKYRKSPRRKTLRKTRRHK